MTCSLFCEELEISLPTRSPLKPLYLAPFHIDPSHTDWRYVEDLYKVLQFDLNRGGFCKTVALSEKLDKALHWPDVRSNFHLSVWRESQIAYLVAVQFFQNRLSPVVFDIENGSSKRYPDLLLTGQLEKDRTLLHNFSDALHKDLFGSKGVASLRLLYAQRNSPLLEGERASEIWISDLDGHNQRQLTQNGGYCLSPTFFKGKEEFLYVSFKGGQSKIYTSKGDLLISLRGNQALPALSPKGDLLAFISDVAGRPDLFMQRLDENFKPRGKARQLFSASRATQASPTFSPDGKQIAFVSDKDGPPRIYLLNVAGPRETRKPRPRLLTSKGRENSSPAWSPDGTKLAYSAKIEGVRQVCIYDFTTQEEIQLTQGPEMKENPAWAPDNLHLVYNTESEESCELYLIDLHQKEPICISKGVGQKRFPCWEQ